jgi:hypothetical protein
VDDSVSDTRGFINHAKILIQMINDHAESRSNHGYSTYTYVPTQLKRARPGRTAASR